MSDDAFFGSNIRTARKAHRCDYCWQAISIGERYVNARFVHSGDFQHQHLHPECDDDIQELARENFGEYWWTPGENPRPKATTP